MRLLYNFKMINLVNIGIIIYNCIAETLSIFYLTGGKEPNKKKNYNGNI